MQQQQQCARPSVYLCRPSRRLSFDDLHNTGLYTWAYLHDLGHHKFSRAKQYIQRLREQGLSRDPRAGGRSSSSKRAPPRI